MKIPSRTLKTSLVRPILFAAAMAAPAMAQTAPARPILFVHGFCDTASSWQLEYEQIRSFVSDDPIVGVQYRSDPNISVPQQIYYDGNTVKTYPQGVSMLSSGAVDVRTRFFALDLFDGHSTGLPLPEPSFNAVDVAGISIFNKGDEVAQAVQAITEFTHVTDVIVIAHSMGGLDARAYMEGLAVPFLNGQCLDDGSGGDSTETYTTCLLAKEKYLNDVAFLVTLDTPHSGVVTANIINAGGWVSDIFGILPWCQCALADPDLRYSGTLNRRELDEGSWAVMTINTSATDLPITAVENYTIPGFNISSGDDGVVLKSEQSIQQIGPYPGYHDLANQVAASPFPVVSGCWPLHQLPCLGTYPSTWEAAEGPLTSAALSGSYNSITVNAFQNGQPWSGSLNYTFTMVNSTSVAFAGTKAPQTFSGIPAGSYQVVNVSGGPGSSVSTQATIGPGAWISNLTITFGATPPSVQTLAAANVNTGYPTLEGQVNQNGSAVSAWFRWGTDPTLTNSSTQTSPPQTFPAGNATVYPFFVLPDVEPSTNFYFQIVANGAGGAVETGAIFNFTTSAAMPAPSLQSPANASIGVALTPTLTWSAVGGAASYRVLISTNQQSLPTDPILKTCSSSCVWYDTPINASDVIPSGILAPYTTHFWEVHARSASQYGTWSSPVYSFTTGAAPPQSDFSLQASPATATANPGQSTSYLLTTATTSGSPQTIALIVENLPSGISSAAFNPSSVNSGSPSTLAITLGASIPTGSYALTIVGAGIYETHSIQVILQVAATSSGPAVTLLPTSQTFPNEVVGTSSPPQTASIINSGNAALTISSISIGAGSDYYFTLPANTNFPFILNPQVPLSLQVYFLPSTTGPRPGVIYVWDNAPGSPHTFSFTGTGLTAPPTTGVVQVLGTLNGVQLPGWYVFDYTLTGPGTYNGFGDQSFNVTAGSYTLSFDTCCQLTLSSITPSPTQTVPGGGAVTFTMNFTAPNDFSGPYFGTNAWTQIVLAGTTASYSVAEDYSPNPVTPITLSVAGLPAGAAGTFNPQPMYGDSTLTVGTSGTAPGLYTLSLIGTNSSGLVHAGQNTAALVVTAPPTAPTNLVSVTSSGAEGNTGGTAGGLSGDGRHALFGSFASDLIPPGVNVAGFVRDLQAGTTTLVTVDTTGNPFVGAEEYVISENAQYVGFLGSTSSFSGLYLRDLQHNTTEREDVSSTGVPSNDSSPLMNAVSADGRYVAFSSSATNLVAGVTSGVEQVYLRDRTAGTTVLVSVAQDGTPANQTCYAAVMSADGRYIAFMSAATNLVSQNLNSRVQVFLRDMQAGLTSLVSVAADGTSANSGIYTGSNIAVSSNGRFISFSSLSTNLVSEPTDGEVAHLFLRDSQNQTTTLVDTDATGDLLGGNGGGSQPSISADGRFVCYSVFNQTMIRDFTSTGSLVLSVAPDGTPGNATSTSSSISAGGTAIEFTSNASNLVAGDTNNSEDAFVAANPFVGAVHAQSLALSSATVLSGGSVTGTVTLNAAAPAAGASVTVTVNDSAAQTPATAQVPAGSSAGTFTINTSPVSNETVLTVIASYNGGSPIALLTIEPGAIVEVNPITWDFGGQGAGTTSAPASFAVQNVGTAAAAIGSVSLSSGQVFHVTSNGCTGSVAAGGSCTVAVDFAPSQAGTSSSDALQVTYGNPATTISVPLSGYSPAPPVVSAVIAPTPIPGGMKAQGAVVLSEAAPSNTTVTLTSGSPKVAKVPSSVTVVAGSSSATFNITAGTVGLPTNAIITAVANSGSSATVVTVDPAGGLWLTDVSASPASVTGGSPSTGTVILNTVAPTGGLTVTLSSTNASVTTPASVNVAAGNNSATFPITTTAVATKTTATIRATYDGGTVTGTLSVKPPALQSVALHPASVTGGKRTTQNAVKLTGPAPSGGVTVTLSSNSSVASVPTSVTVPAGATSADFTISTTTVASPVTVTIQASYGSVSKSASLAVQP